MNELLRAWRSSTKAAQGSPISQPWMTDDLDRFYWWHTQLVVEKVQIRRHGVRLWFVRSGIGLAHHAAPSQSAALELLASACPPLNHRSFHPAPAPRPATESFLSVPLSFCVCG